MRGYAYTIRPAGAAIAAVLALSSTPSFAQDAAAAETPTETVVVPPAASPASSSSPAFAPAQPVVQQTPSVEERLAAAVAASEAEAANRQATPATRVERRAAPVRTERVQSAPTEPAPIRAAEPATAPVTQPTPAAAPAAVPEPPVSAPQRDNAAMRETDGKIDPALYWALGGGALLLLGLGGAAALRRRRHLAVDEAEPLATTVTEPARPIERPITPTFAAAPVSAIARPQGTTLDEMVAAPPSPENPFRTHKKRMTRAKFLLAQHERQTVAHATPAAEAAWTPTPAARRDQTQAVYRFGSERGRSSNWKPQTR